MSKEIGIDLGTTNTVVTYVNNKGRLRPLRFEGKDMIPSVLYFISENEFIIGEKAKKKGLQNPGACVTQFKSHMGDGGKLSIVPEHGQPFKCHAKKLASLFLNQIINHIERQLIKEFGPEEGCIGSAVITVPAKFNNAEKAATKWAAQDAGFEDIRLTTESTAAAVAHRNESGLAARTVLVYDFGGGTFDVSIIKEQGSRFVEVATGGDKTLGGNTLRNLLAQYLVELVEDEYGIELPLSEDDFDEDVHGISLMDYQRNRMEIIEEADRVKEALSEEEDELALLNLILPGRPNAQWTGMITRKDLDRIIGPKVERTIQITKSVYQEAREKGVEEIDQIVLAGGSSQLSMVKERMEQEFRQVIYADDISTLIARGAALLANRELADVTEAITSIQYGVAVSEGVLLRSFKVIIPENEKLPCSGKEYFTLNKDGQRQLTIPYFERDIKNFPQAIRTDEDGITQIDTLIISDLPEGLRKDEVRIGVEFRLQLDGTLEVHAEVLDLSGRRIRQAVVSYERGGNLE